MTPRWILPVAAALTLAASVSAHAATIQITMENLVISPAEASAKIVRHHRMDQQGRLCPPRDGAKRRLGRDIAAGEDRLSLSETQSG